MNSASFELDFFEVACLHMFRHHQSHTPQPMAIDDNEKSNGWLFEHHDIFNPTHITKVPYQSYDIIWVAARLDYISRRCVPVPTSGDRSRQMFCSSSPTDPISRSAIDDAARPGEPEFGHPKESSCPPLIGKDDGTSIRHMTPCHAMPSHSGIDVGCLATRSVTTHHSMGPLTALIPVWASGAICGRVGVFSSQ